MRKIKVSFLLVFLFWYTGFPQESKGQNLQLVTTIPIPKPEKVSIDRFNNIYIAETKGNIHQFNSSGKLLQTFSHNKPGKISHLEAWQAVTIFVFYQDFQQILFLDRFLTPSPNISLNDLQDGFIRLATISNDQNLWLIDESDLSLKKYNLKQNNFTIISPLNLQLNSKRMDLNFIREYQNHLFINDRLNGIHIFDILGNYLRSIPEKDLEYFNFLKDEMYFLRNNNLHFLNIYNQKERTLATPEQNPIKFILASEKQVFLITDSALKIYTY
ncbi:hypothetical protein BH23BAC1_BH23BAC1_29890 [soil metagenome]